jgi:hypothetical protein
VAYGASAAPWAEVIQPCCINQAGGRPDGIEGDVPRGRRPAGPLRGEPEEEITDRLLDDGTAVEVTEGPTLGYQSSCNSWCRKYGPVVLTLISARANITSANREPAGTAVLGTAPLRIAPGRHQETWAVIEGWRLTWAWLCFEDKSGQFLRPYFFNTGQVALMIFCLLTLCDARSSRRASVLFIASLVRSSGAVVSRITGIR